MSIIAISGKIGSGKDLIGEIIQQLFWWKNTEANMLGYNYNSFLLLRETGQYKHNLQHYSKSEIKRFADSLKDIVCILLGCSREQLEDRKFKEKELGEEWWQYGLIRENCRRPILYPSKKEDIERQLEVFENSKMYINKLTPRKLLQLLGTNVGRDIIHPNLWVNALFSKYVWDGKSITDGWIPTYNNPDNSGCDIPAEPIMPNWIITDLRFPNELKAVKDRGGVSIRVNRDNEQVLKDKGIHIPKHLLTPEHKSETALDDAEFDYVIDNNGTIEDLIHIIKEILIKEKII